VNGFLLDTNIPSETLRPYPDPKVIRWLRAGSSKDAQFISVVSIGELRRGAALLPASARRTQLERFLVLTLPEWFESRILPVTETIADRWGVLDARRQLAGKPITIADGLIAATALEHGLTIATRNVRDFADLELPIINPWDN
jgi:predicted nucleic acid-binding protein